MAYCDHKTTGNCPDCIKDLAFYRSFYLDKYRITMYCNLCQGFGKSAITQISCPKCSGTGMTKYIEHVKENKK